MSAPAPVSVPIRRQPGCEDLDLPAYRSEGAAGMDLAAAVPDRLVIQPGARALIPTGVAMAFAEGTEGQIRPRSGLALEHGVTVLNAPGTIDSDYRGEVRVVLANFGPRPFAVERGMRIAQLVVAPVLRAAWTESPALPASARGVVGFGSTGVAARGADGAD